MWKDDTTTMYLISDLVSANFVESISSVLLVLSSIDIAIL